MPALGGRSSSEGSICPGFSLPISSSGPPNVLTGRGAQARDHQNRAGRGSIPLRTDSALSRSCPPHAHSAPPGHWELGEAPGLTPSLTDRYGEAGGGPAFPWVSVLGGAGRSPLFRWGPAALGLAWLLMWKRRGL